MLFIQAGHCQFGTAPAARNSDLPNSKYIVLLVVVVLLVLNY